MPRGGRFEGARGVAIAALVSLLAACGAKPVATPKLPPVKPVGVAPSLAPTEDAAVRALLDRVRAASAGVRNFTATAYTKMRTPAGGTDHNLAKISWRRSGTMSATVLDAGVAKKKSTKLIFDGKREVRVRTYFFGFLPLTITLDVEDPRLVDGYQWAAGVFSEAPSEPEPPPLCFLGASGLGAGGGWVGCAGACGAGGQSSPLA